MPCKCIAWNEKTSQELLPTKALLLADCNLNSPNATIRVRLSANALLFFLDNATIYTRLVEGCFPPWEKFVSAKMPAAFQLPAAEFAAKICQAKITADDESKRVDSLFVPSKVTMQARGPETGSSEVDMSLPSCNGPKIDIAFDPSHLLEMLKAVDGEPSIQMEPSERALRPSSALVTSNDDNARRTPSIDFGITESDHHGWIGKRQSPQSTDPQTHRRGHEILRCVAFS